jgi:hypothetical protein
MNKHLLTGVFLGALMALAGTISAMTWPDSWDAPRPEAPR